MTDSQKRIIIFDRQFREDLRWWFKQDKKIANRILDLVEATITDPFVGIGKPECLKYQETNTWSRRITKEHRLVYRVKGDLAQGEALRDRLDFLQARYHY